LFAGVLRIIFDGFEGQNMKTNPHVMQKACTLGNPQLIGSG
jgi:hypothetical protein